MKRIPEPELMNDSDQAKAYAAADFSRSDQNFIVKLEKYISVKSKVINNKSLIVDIGCGPGNITERLAFRWPFAEIVGIDGSEEMLTIARSRQKQNSSLIQLEGLSYIHQNLASFAKERLTIVNNADVIVSNSLLHHIHNPNLFWKAIQNIGKSGTIIFLKDLRRPKSFKEVKRLQEKYQPNASAILNRDYLASLQAAFTISEVKSQLDFAGLCQLKVFEVDDRYLEVVGIL